MELYKEKLKKQNILLGICCLVLLIFCALSLAGEMGLVDFMEPTAGDSHWQSRWRGFVMGASCGIMAVMVVGMIRSIRAMKDEKRLKKLYVQEHDERQIQIYTAARAAATQTFLLVGLAVGVIAGYFSVAVSITVLACVWAHALIAMGFKLYYSKKF